MSDTYVTQGIVLSPGSVFTPSAHHLATNRVFGLVEIPLRGGIGSLRIEAEHPAPLRRLATALTEAADQADALLAAAVTA